jgi:hypothetical protein
MKLFKESTTEQVEKIITSKIGEIIADLACYGFLYYVLISLIYHLITNYQSLPTGKIVILIMVIILMSFFPIVHMYAYLMKKS